MIITLAFAFVSLMAIGLIMDGKNFGCILKTGVPYAALAGLFNGATNFLMLYVFTLIPISVASPSNAGIEIIISFILSKLMFKEVFEKRQVVSGIAQYYEPEDLIGKKVVIVANLKPVKLCGEDSFGMILWAANDNQLSIVSPSDDMEIGSEVR